MIFSAYGADGDTYNVDQVGGERWTVSPTSTQTQSTSQVVNIGQGGPGAGKTPTWVWAALAFVGSVTLIGGAYALRK